MTPIITDFLARGKTPDEAMAEIEEWRAGNSRRVLVDRHFKLMLDGAIFSGLAQMGPGQAFMIPRPLQHHGDSSSS